MSTNMPVAIHNGTSDIKLDDIDVVSPRENREQYILPISHSSSDRGHCQSCKECKTLPDKGYSIPTAPDSGYNIHTAPDNGYNIPTAPDNGYNIPKAPDNGYSLHIVTEECSTPERQNDREKSARVNTSNLSENLMFDSEESILNVGTCSVDQTNQLSPSAIQKSSTMECPRASSLAKRVQQELEIYEKQKTNGTNEESTYYSNSWFVVGRIEISGGVLQVRGDSGDRVVILRIPEGALTEPREIYMAVDWHGSGFSPTVKCGPPGTRFHSGVYIFLPIYGKSEELILRKRQDDDADKVSPWVENPESCSSLATESNCVIETHSFSDYEMVPSGDMYKEFNLQVYAQQAAVGGLICIRYYLVDNDGDALQKRVKAGEKCLDGYCVENFTLRVKKGGEEMKTTVESQGLKSLEHHPTRTTTEEWISNAKEMSSGFILRQSEGAHNPEACLKFELPGIPVVKCVEIKVQDETSLTVEQQAVMLHDNIQPQDSTNSILSFQMVERLSALIDIREDSSLTLINLMQPGMTIVKLNPDKVCMQGGSRTRYVLRYYECLCIVKGTDREEALRELKSYLRQMGEERAVDIVKEYLLRRNPGRLFTQDRKKDSGCYSDSRLSQKLKEENTGADGTNNPELIDTRFGEENTFKEPKESEASTLKDLTSDSSVTKCFHDKTKRDGRLDLDNLGIGNPDVTINRELESIDRALQENRQIPTLMVTSPDETCSPTDRPTEGE